jgi:hypothetical protein
LIEDGAEGAFGEVAGVIGNRCVAVGLRVGPDFVAAGSLAIKAETEELETARDFAITESSEAAQSSAHNNHEVAALIAGCEGRRSVALAAGLDELAGNVAGDFECFSDGTTLGDEAGKLFGGREIDAFRKQFHVNLKGEFHPETRVA